MRKFLSIAMVALMALAIVSCKTADNTNTDKPNKMVPNSTLKNTRWVLQTLQGAAITTPENARDIYILLEHEGSRFNGNAGCNRITGEVTVGDNNKIKMDKVAGTKMFCDNLETENKFLKIFDIVDSYKIKGEVLVLFANEKAVAVFKAVYL